MHNEVVVLDVLGNILICPGGQRVELDATSLVDLQYRRVCAGRRVDALQTCDPALVGALHGRQRLDLPQCAATRRVGLVQINALFGVLLGAGALRLNRQQSVVVTLCDLLCHVEGLREVVTGIQENQICLRRVPSSQFRQHCVLHRQGHSQWRVQVLRTPFQYFPSSGSLQLGAPLQCELNQTASSFRVVQRVFTRERLLSLNDLSGFQSRAHDATFLSICPCSFTVNTRQHSRHCQA